MKTAKKGVEIEKRETGKKGVEIEEMKAAKKGVEIEERETANLAQQGEAGRGSFVVERSRNTVVPEEQEVEVPEDVLAMVSVNVREEDYQTI
uniref:Uncharacterized protein n=1 Tax=Chromera velia CCMP2878 TaxID=1169474 RepID=A0A0G4HRE3_9ALVE|eukprot:Cvel_30584.t1-p1 / transcript=Cvel_30584.t1 / gene=Cvel_30584 / organism=Chromera_velia_CCMP2878 / gene_product=hypothetical protein / transcript_product=hypothetical protein / location=Cvel_scaffold4381:7097-7660(-) / protein_length=91 / sequence_SO=supercontig / SO=protein_coding / is_pseudo=false